MLNWVAIRRAAATTLVISFFLPLAQCPRVERTGTLTPNHEPIDISAFSAYQWPSAGGAVALLLFLWPVMFELGKALQRRHTRLVLASCLGLCVASVAWVTWIVAWGRTIRWGAFVAYASIIGYGLAVVASYRARRGDKPRRAEATSPEA